jgi:hypothetical protein
LVELFEMTYSHRFSISNSVRNLAAIHRERQTIKPRDMRLVLSLVRIIDPDHVLVRDMR